MSPERLDMVVAELESLRDSVRSTVEFQAEIRGVIKIIQWVGAGFMSFMTIFCMATGGIVWSSLISLESIKTQLPFIKPTVTDADIKLIARDIQDLQTRITTLEQNKVSKR